MTSVVLALVAFGAMEVVAYLVHRFVMHGVGAAWHHSHHQPRRGRFEANDLYPVVASVLTIAAFALGAAVEGLALLTPIAAGVTAYGVAYLLVHDVAIHRRVPLPVPDVAAFRSVREAHRIHHLWSGEPYGFLLPIVSRAARDRAALVARDPLA